MQNVKSGNLILSLATPEFKEYFAKYIEPHVNEIEKIRLSCTKTLFWRFGASLALMAALFYLIARFMPGPIDIIMCSIPVTILGTKLLCDIYEPIKIKYKIKTKAKIMQAILNWFGEFTYRSNFNPPQIHELLKQLKVHPDFSILETDDCFYGKYNNLNLSVNEIAISYSQRGYTKECKTATIFKGLMITSDINKNFDSHTVILGSGDCTTGNELSKVFLEDAGFNKRFAVHSSNQVEARYLLTPSFMKRLVDLPKSKNIQMAFKDKKVYIFIKYKKDMLEIPLLKPATDMKHYQAILVELAEILSIIDSLKLEQDIGL